jgi:hypothetical protein
MVSMSIGSRRSWTAKSSARSSVPKATGKNLLWTGWL